MISFHSHSWNFLCLFFLLQCLVLKRTSGEVMQPETGHMFLTRKTASGCAGHPARGGPWSMSFITSPRLWWGALGKRVWIYMGIVVFQGLILWCLLCRWVKGKQVRNHKTHVFGAHERLVSVKASPATCVCFTILTPKCTSAAALNSIFSRGWKL